LTIDHINNDGWAERKKHRTGKTGGAVYHRLRHKKFPTGYQTLCMNHQLKKEILRKRALIGTV
jgi:hypothetical protein